MRLAITQFGLLILMLVSPVSGWAALSLNVSPYDGGNSLRLGRVDDQTASSKEVRIRINSGDGKQYQVFQRLAQGLVSERGESLRADTLKTYSLVGSNSQGTLYQQDLGSLGAAEQLLYTSSPNGDSDSFTMIYSLDGNGLNANGDFLGQIAYTVRSIGGGAQEDVYLNLLVEAGGQWQVDVTGSSGQGLVRLNSLRSGADKGDITINFSGNANQNIAVELERSQGLQSDAGNFLPEEALQFYVSGGESGSISYPNPTTLDGQRVAVYAGEGIQDSLKVQLLLNNDQVSALKSVIYGGRCFVLFNLC